MGTKDLLQPKTTQSSTTHKINQRKRNQRQATRRSKPTPKASQPCYQWMPKSLVFHLNNGYAWVPKMILQPGTLVTSSPHTAPQRLPKIVEPTSKLVWRPKQSATQLTPSKVDSHKQTTTKNNQVWGPKSASTPSPPPPPWKPAQNVIQ